MASGQRQTLPGTTSADTTPVYSVFTAHCSRNNTGDIELTQESHPDSPVATLRHKRKWIWNTGTIHLPSTNTNYVIRHSRLHAQCTLFQNLSEEGQTQRPVAMAKKIKICSRLIHFHFWLDVQCHSHISFAMEPVSNSSNECVIFSISAGTKVQVGCISASKGSNVKRNVKRRTDNAREYSVRFAEGLPQELPAFAFWMYYLFFRRLTNGDADAAPDQSMGSA